MNESALTGHVKAIAVTALVLVSTISIVLGAQRQAGTVESGTRAAWKTSRIHGSPEPPLPFVAERVFPALKFTNCLDLAAMPGSDRLFVVEQAGKIFSFPNKPDVKQADLVIDLAQAVPGVQQVYALAFHPEFTRNRFCYICYIRAANLADGTHIARFRVSETNPPIIEPTSEHTVITFYSGGHNGCCLKFGPDGFLYISTGDGSDPNPPDSLRTGQSVDDLLSAILRIDVDKTETGRNYRIPPDNPFVGVEGARGEIWAYGFRNPWRMSFDRNTGDLWVGDVGWELWELLDRVERGGNYGWSIVEGRQATNPEWPRGPTPILPPTIDHPHSESSSITDGLTYYGKRLHELDGNHIYSDYDTGKFWAFRFEKGRVVELREIADTTHRVVGFGEDANGEFYFLDHPAGTIHTLIPNPSRDKGSTFPRTLGESGIFASVINQTPAVGVLPYSINAEPWADHTVAERWVAIPGTLAIRPEIPNWIYPADSVLVKTISLDMVQNNPASRRRVETQILHFDGEEWQPYTYRWNDEQTDARLVEAGGDECTFEVVDSSATSGKRRQVWRFAGRGECQRCHNKWSGPPLAFNTPQLNRNTKATASSLSQLDSFARIGLFEKPIASENRPKLADPRDCAAELDGRARAYLQVNCAHCHRMHAGSSVLSKMHYDLPIEKTDMVGVRPTQGTFGIHGVQVIAAGDPFRSVLLYRLAKLRGGRMPHIGSTEVDREGVALIHDWIRQIPPGSIATDIAGNAAAIRLSLEEAAEIEQLKNANGTSDDSTKLIDHLLASTSGALRILQSIDRSALPAGPVATAIEKGTRHEDPSIRDLFERFLPPEKRVKRLGTAIRPEQILSFSGDAARGRQVFFETAGIQCKNCHRIGNEGQDLGPELTTIGKKLDRSQLLESMLEPSKLIEPKYVTWLAETSDGKVATGLLITKDETEVVLKDAQNKRICIPQKMIEQLVPQRLSLMPELLLRDMTAQQVADLIAYMSMLK
jgi:putative heme-binding domain-containing protein